MKREEEALYATNSINHSSMQGHNHGLPSDDDGYDDEDDEEYDSQEYDEDEDDVEMVTANVMILNSSY